MNHEPASATRAHPFHRYRRTAPPSRQAIDDAVARVLTHCQFINGPEVARLEADLAEFSGAKHVVACASGTDALLMVLMAKGIGPGDAGHLSVVHFLRTGRGGGADRGDAGLRRCR